MNEHFCYTTYEFDMSWYDSWGACVPAGRPMFVSVRGQLCGM
jgi:hypothetical protein